MPEKTQRRRMPIINQNRNTRVGCTFDTRRFSIKLSEVKGRALLATIDTLLRKHDDNTNVLVKELESLIGKNARVILKEIFPNESSIITPVEMATSGETLVATTKEFPRHAYERDARHASERDTRVEYYAKDSTERLKHLSTTVVLLQSGPLLSKFQSVIKSTPPCASCIVGKTQLLVVPFGMRIMIHQTLVDEPLSSLSPHTLPKSLEHLDVTLRLVERPLATNLKDHHSDAADNHPSREETVSVKAANMQCAHCCDTGYQSLV